MMQCASCGGETESGTELCTSCSALLPVAAMDKRDVSGVPRHDTAPWFMNCSLRKCSLHFVSSW